MHVPYTVDIAYDEDRKTFLDGLTGEPIKPLIFNYPPRVPLTQFTLDRWVADLRDWGYPYLGSDDSTHTLLSDGRIEWRASDPFDDDGEDWVTVQTVEDFEESVQAWRYDY